MQSPNHPVSNFGLRGTTKLISSLNEIRGMVPSAASSLVEAARPCATQWAVRCDPGYLSYRLWIPYHLKYISQGNHMQSPNHPVSNFGLRGTRSEEHTSELQSLRHL